MGRFTTTWTDDETETLKTLWTDGVSASLIGDKLHRSRNAILGRLFRLGLLAGGSQQYVTAPRKPEKRKPAGRITKNPVGYRAFVDPVEPLNVSFMEVRADQCKWVCGTGDDGLATYCGHEIRSGSYCLGHYQIAHAASPPRPTAPRKSSVHTFVDYQKRAA